MVHKMDNLYKMDSNKSSIMMLVFFFQKQSVELQNNRILAIKLIL